MEHHLWLFTNFAFAAKNWVKTLTVIATLDKAVSRGRKKAREKTFIQAAREKLWYRLSFNFDIYFLFQI